MHTHVVSYGRHRFPAFLQDGMLIADFRTFGPDAKLGWHPEKLPDDVPAATKEAAAESDPQGFVAVAV